MDTNFKFSVIKSNLYVNSDEDNVIFDINKIEKVNMDFEIIPLHNFFSSSNHDIFDQMVFTKLYFIVGLYKINAQDEWLVNLLLFSEDDIKDFEKNIYGIDFNFTIEEFDFKTPYSYKVKLGYFVGDKEFQDDREAALFYMRQIEENKLFETYIPFEIGGGWFHG